MGKIAMGRDLCSGKTIAFEGVTRMVGGSLSGKVTIQRVSDSQVVGKFHLAGQGKMLVRRFKFTHDSKTHQIDGSKMIDQHASSGPLQASGWFRASNVQGYGAIPAPDPTVLMAARIPPSGGKAGKKKLHLVASLPANDEYNVNWERNLQQIHLTFDQPVDVSTFNKSDAYLEWRNASDQAQRISLQVSGSGSEGKTVVLSHPGVDLKDGVRYRMHLKSGPQGIRGRRGAPLASDYQWDFYTMIDFKHRDRAIPDMEKILTPKEGIEAHVFQVARDAKLVLHKPTLTRVYVKWWKRKDVAKGWQVTKFPATVLVHAGSKDGPLLYHGEEDWIKRPDKYGDTMPYTTTAKRFARNSVNFFGWRPGTSNMSKPSRLVVEIDPKIHCETMARQFYGSGERLSYTDLQVIPRIVYYFLRTGAWKQGVPKEALAVGRRIASAAGVFATQNMPVLGIHVLPGGVLRAPPDSWVSKRVKKVLQNIYPDQRAKVKPAVRRTVLMQWAEDTTAVDGGDIIVVFGPWAHHGGTYRSFVFGSEDCHEVMKDFGHDILAKSCASSAVRFPVPLIMMPVSLQLVSLGAITHELGHAFGLHHRPPTGNSAQRDAVCRGVGSEHGPAGLRVSGAMGEIEGFRISISGVTGFNKSVVEGDAQDMHGLLPLMFPCEGGKAPIYADKNTVFVTDASYKRLIEDFEQYRSVGFHMFGKNESDKASSMMLADRNSNDTVVRAAEEAARRGNYLLVSGRVDVNGNGTIESARRIPRTLRLGGTTGKWRIESVDAEGNVVGRQTVERMPSGDGAFGFWAVVAGSDSVVALRLYDGHHLAASYARGADVPQASILGVRAVNPRRVNVHFTVSGAHKDHLRQWFEYAPSEAGPWMVVGGWSGTDSATLDATAFVPGPSPTLKLLVTDGFDEYATTRSVSQLAKLRVMSTQPTGGEGGPGVYPQRPDVSASFNADLARGAISKRTFSLKDSGGGRVAAKVLYAAADRMAVLVPDEPLKTGERYTATLSGSIADRFGDTLGKPVSWRFVQQAPPGATARVAESAAAPEAAPVGGATRAAGAQTRKPLNWSGAGGAPGGLSGGNEPVGGTPANPPGTTTEASIQKGLGLPQPMYVAGAGTQGNGVAPPGAVMPNLNAPGYSASGAAQEAGGGGAGQTLKGGHGHLKIGKLKRDFAIDSCHFQSVPGGELAAVSVQQPGLQLHITASPMAPGVQIQQVSVILGAASAGITYTADRMEQGGSWHDEAGHGASGPLIRIQGHRVSVAGMFSETAVNVQRNVAGTIEADCGG